MIDIYIYIFPPLETWELIGEPTIFASGHLEMEQKNVTSV